MSKQKTSKGTPKSTCSQESESGAQHSDSQESQTLDLFGQPLAPARTSPSREKDKA